jgi:hypothetical protein
VLTCFYSSPKTDLDTTPTILSPLRHLAIVAYTASH